MLIQGPSPPFECESPPWFLHYDRLGVARIEIEVAQGLGPGKVASTDPVGAAPVQKVVAAEVPAEEVEVLALRVLGSSDSVHGVAVNIS